MTRRGLRKYIDDLLAGRRPASFPADDFEAAQIRTAIELRAAQPGADEPRPEFVSDLKSRIAEQLSHEQPAEPAPARRVSSATRRQVIVGTSAAATAAVAAVSIDHLLTGRAKPADSRQAEVPELVPVDGVWQPVAKSTALTEGSVLPFDLETVSGFVRRTAGGKVDAVSGVCTHQGCKLFFDDTADNLRCPCHVTSFSPAGQVLTHQLPIAPKPLPHFDVREHDGIIEVLGPRPPAEPG
ncbi:Rieske Fe-S protein [Mycobacterium frederiksbergense]|uniref:Rieske Fe-S protein n=1 Tax=Mycolicibacterium frederiksbergense TaxID=117567 RepID=A0ABT6L1K6_9MYCO|nr:Rieske 2Fe-2S domain-containing protein [Mycolicibacterium frederiksbergense]MDH6196837.1 Rieske Fe-S protein [Mycolicibacterium frederiksbergense]